MIARGLLLLCVIGFVFLVLVNIIVHSEGRIERGYVETPCESWTDSSGHACKTVACLGSFGGTCYDSPTSNTTVEPSTNSQSRCANPPAGCVVIAPPIACSTNNKSISWGYSCNDVPHDVTTPEIPCPLYCTCPNPVGNKPCKRSTWDTNTCTWTHNMCNVAQCNGPTDYGTYPGSGCASGFVDSGDGFCDMSASFQSSCANGYDGYTCSCLPPPVGYCQGAPYPDGTCATGFVNTGGTCDRSLAFQSRCADPSGYAPESCSCPDGTIGGSPIIVDVDGSGFSLTNPVNGVDFDLFAVGFPQRLSWTSSAATNVFLVLDRNGNGAVDNGTELFGDISPQPPSLHPNGFIALAEYDKPQNGGNGDKAITTADRIFNNLRLWRDSNHNGLSELNELHSLSDLSIQKIDLDYRASRQTDDFGNVFRYRAKVYGANGQQTGRWAYDVFLVTGN